MTHARYFSLGFVGDLAFNRKVRDVISRHGPRYIFEEVKPHFDPLNLMIGNLECSIVDDRGATAVVKRPLWTTPEAASALKHSEIDVVTLANNHVMDCGPEGLKSTLRHLDSLGIRYFGAGETLEEAEAPLFAMVQGYRIAFLGASDLSYSFAGPNRPGVAQYSERRLLARVREARRQCDMVVVVLHADVEFVRYPAPHRRRLSHRLVEAGAPLVVQHHPHVIQGIECDGSSLIAYSLGNHVFAISNKGYQGKHQGTRESLLLSVNVDLGKEAPRFSYDTVPMLLDDTHRPVPCDPQAAAKRHEELERLSANLADSHFQRHHWLRTSQKLAWEHVKQTYYAVRKKGFIETLKFQIRFISRPKHWRWIIGFFSAGYR